MNKCSIITARNVGNTLHRQNDSLHETYIIQHIGFFDRLIRPKHYVQYTNAGTHTMALMVSMASMAFIKQTFADVCFQSRKGNK